MNLFEVDVPLKDLPEWAQVVFYHIDSRYLWVKEQGVWCNYYFDQKNFEIDPNKHYRVAKLSNRALKPYEPDDEDKLDEYHAGTVFEILGEYYTQKPGRHRAFTKLTIINDKIVREEPGSSPPDELLVNPVYTIYFDDTGVEEFL